MIPDQELTYKVKGERCFNCNKFGHFARHCKIGKTEDNKKCYKCGGSGHFKKGCSEKGNNCVKKNKNIKIKSWYFGKEVSLKFEDFDSAIGTRPADIVENQYLIKAIHLASSKPDKKYAISECGTPRPTLLF